MHSSNKYKSAYADNQEPVTAALPLGVVGNSGFTGVPECDLEERASSTTDQRLFPLIRDSPSSRWMSALLLSRRASL